MTIGKLSAVVMRTAFVVSVATLSTQAFTGDVPTDFTGPDVSVVADPMDVGLPTQAPGGTISGWEVQFAAFELDPNADMLRVGAEREKNWRFAGRAEFVEANAEELPFEDASYDAYTIAFGIRNVPRIDKALAEAYRVLAPGGRFMCLEFSEIAMPFLDKIYERWSFDAIPRIGQAVTGDAEPYRYLVESIRMFPNQRDFASMIGRAGFERVTWRDYTAGVAAAHSGWKI